MLFHLFAFGLYADGKGIYALFLFFQDVDDIDGTASPDRGEKHFHGSKSLMVPADAFGCIHPQGVARPVACFHEVIVVDPYNFNFLVHNST